MPRPRAAVLLAAGGIAAAAVAGCGSSSPARSPTAAEMSRLRAHLADAQTAATNHDRAAVTGALDALGADVAVLRRHRDLSPTQATLLATEVAQARSRAKLELPAPAPPAPVAPAATAPPAPASPPATAATPPPAPAAQPVPGGKGKGKGHGKGPDKKHGGGHGGD